MPDSSACPRPCVVSSFIRDYYNRVDVRPLDVHDLFAEDCEYRRPGYPPMLGRAAVAQFYAQERVIRSGRHELETFVVEGSQVAVRGRFRGVLRDGRTVETGFADFFRVRQEASSQVRIVDRWTYFDVPSV